jgi:ParB/RepB/Spo0J family partition protein
MELEFHQLDLRYERLRVRRNDVERRLLASLLEIGQQVPIAVVPAEESGRYVVIDGFRRIRALRRLGRDTVGAMVWAVPEAEALLVDRSQRQSSALSAIEQGWVLRELSERHGLRGEQLAQRLGRSASWVSRHLGLVRELSPQLQEQVRLGRLPAQAVMKYLLPIHRRRREDAQALAEAAVRLRLSSRDLGELCRGWLSAKEPLRARLIADPELFLRSRAELGAPDPRPEAPGERLLRDLELVGVLLRRSSRLLRQSWLEPQERERLTALATDAAAELRRLAAHLAAEGNRADAEAASTHDDPRASRAGDEPARDREEPEAVAQDGQTSGAIRPGGGAPAAAPERLRAAPRADPRAAQLVSGQPGAGP